MLNKNPRPFWRKVVIKSAKIAFVAEVVAFGAFYGFWYRTNTSQDFRKYLNNNYPVVLEQYYKFGELLDSENAKIRQIDLKTWADSN